MGLADAMSLRGPSVLALAALALAACGSDDGSASATNAPPAYDAAADGAPEAAPSTDAGDASAADAHDGADGSGGPGDAGGEDGSDAAPSCPSPALADVLTFTLTHAADPNSGHPDVAVHVPPGFDPCRRPSLVVFFHGFDNCVQNVVGSVDTACTPGGPTRSALHLDDQLDAARVNALLVAVEIVFDQATGVPGHLADPGEFAAMLHELCATHLSPLVGAPLDVASFEKIVLASHSGGYESVGSVLDVGGVEVSEVELFDSLYGYYPSYAGWIEADLARFGPGAAKPRRFSDVFTSTGGTQALSETLEAEVEAALAPAGLSASLFYQDATAPTPTDAELAHPLVWKHSELTHDGVPRYYFGRLVAEAGIAPLP